MEAADGGGEALEDLLALVMVVSSKGMVAWVPALGVAPNGSGRDAMETALAQDAWVPAEAAWWTGWIPGPDSVVMDGPEALAVAVRYGWISPSSALVMELEQNQDFFAPMYVPDNHAAAAASMGNTALYLALLSLPAREVARCRMVCRLWRDITSTEDFRLDHHDHHFRTPMPLFFFLDPRLVRPNLCAVDIRNRVPRQVIRYARPPNHEVLMIHGSCAGVLLLSSGRRLYACNPCTRRWTRLAPVQLHFDIIGFYFTVTDRDQDPGDFEFHVLCRDRWRSRCAYWICTLGTTGLTRRCIGRRCRPIELRRVLRRGIAPSCKIPPVFFCGYLHWPPKAALDNSNVLLVFDTRDEYFSQIPPPSIQVGGEDVPVVGRQVFEIDQHIAMTAISLSTATVDVWVRSNITAIWSRLYSIRVPVEEIRLNNSCHHNASVFAVAHDRNDLVQCPRILLQCDALGDELERYELADHWTSLSGHTLEESLLLHPDILPMQDTDAVDGDPPFFQN
uniref:Uncharacterized protein n=1 Tax=Avena sativa TaxID=4498 RepID=A0ACD5XL41_AVESA